MSHSNGYAVSSRVEGVRAQPRTLEGPGFSLSLEVNGDGVEVAVDGRASPEQVLRLLAQSGCLEPASSARVDVTVDTTEGADRYVYTADLSHRLLFRRSWNRKGLVGVLYGLNPFVADTEGPVAQVPGRATLRNTVGILSHGGALSRIDVLNLFTYRSRDAASLKARASDRVAAPDLERDVLREADVVLLAWGAKVRPQHRPAVEALLDVLESVGKQPSMLERDGALLTAGSPPQPAHPSRIGYRRVRPVAVGRDEVLGGRSPSRSPHATAKAASADVEPPQPIGDTPSPEVPPPTQPHPSPVRQALAWADAHLDALGREAVRRLVAGEVHTPPHPAVPAGERLLLAAHGRGDPRAALDLVVTALRLTSGLAWRWIGARYLLAQTDAEPDLQGLGANGKKVSGVQYARPARDAVSRLVGVDNVKVNDLLPGNERSMSVDELARRWAVSDDLVGATVGPGAARWLRAEASTLLDNREGDDTYFRVHAENAGWKREGP